MEKGSDEMWRFPEKHWGNVSSSTSPPHEITVITWMGSEMRSRNQWRLEIASGGLDKTIPPSSSIIALHLFPFYRYPLVLVPLRSWYAS